MRPLRILLPVLALAFAGVAGAATTTVPFSLASGSGSRLLSVAKLDPNVGTLSSVSLVFLAQAANAVTAARKAGTNGSVAYTFAPTNGFTLSTTAGVALGTASGTGSFSDTLNNGHPTSAASVNTTGFRTATTLATSFNAYFTGTGTATMKFATTGTYAAVPTNVVLSNYFFPSGLTGSLTYTYTPRAVPEPASMAVLGLGALGLLRRRRA